MQQVQTREPLEPDFTYRVFTTLLLLGLLLEWLFLWLHAGEWSMLLHPTALMWMTVMMLAIGLIRPRIHLFVLAGVILCLLGLFVVFRDDGQHMLEWLSRLLPSLAQNGKDMFSYGLWYMSDEFRTLLLFTGWLLLAPSLQSMVWHYQLSLSLVAATIVYLLFFHVMLGSNIWLGLLRVIGIGLPLVALTTHFKLRQEHQALPRASGNKRYAVSIGLMTVIIVAGGFLLSDDKGKQSEPVALADLFSISVAGEIAAWSQQSGGMPLKHMTSSTFRNQAVSASGYDQDDSLLGQSLQLNDKIVFYGWSSHEGYWRGETRATYTGKGWADDNSALVLHKVADGADSAVAELGNKGKGDKITQSITYTEPIVGMPLLQAGLKGVVLELQASNPDRQFSSYISEPTTGSLYSPTVDAAINSYTVLTELPHIDVEMLQEVAETDKQLAQRMWEEEMLGEYLQLPDELPERVAALAAEVSGGGWTSRYDQVKAVEQYLQENYSYSLKSNPPGGDGDFVDQFLFEQQQGYCVHFSTAMVVMLRTQHIPARWVKGFQSGEEVSQRTTADSIVENQYKVRAQDAHAWVEVYFPEVGWLPFDPTPANASEAQSQQTGVWLQNMKQLGSDTLAGIQAWGSELSITGVFLSELDLRKWSLTRSQWLWLAAGVTILVSMLVVILLRLPYLRRAILLRRYESYYRGLKENKQILPIVNPSFPGLPARRGTRKSRKSRQAVQQQIRLHAKLEERLQHYLLVLAEDCLKRLEKKWLVRSTVSVGIIEETSSRKEKVKENEKIKEQERVKDVDNGNGKAKVKEKDKAKEKDKEKGKGKGKDKGKGIATGKGKGISISREMTWRGRITELVACCADAGKREQLIRLLEVIERSQYSHDMDAPTPEVLRRLLDGLRPSAKHISTRQRNLNQQNYDEGLSRMEYSSEVPRSSI